MDEVAEELFSLGEASGREEGREEGRVEEKRATAMRLHRKGDDVHSIADAVDASIELICEWLGIAPVTA